MSISQNFRYISLLEIIKKVDKILRQKKSIHHTFEEIVQTIDVSQMLQVPVGLKFMYNDELFSSRDFSNEVVCQQHHFTTHAGNTGFIQLCMGNNQNQDLALMPLEQNFLLDSLLRNILLYLNAMESSDISIQKSTRRSNGQSNGVLSSSFL